MTANGWCFWLNGPGGRDLLFVGEHDESAALAIATKELGDRTVVGRNEIPGSIRDFLEIKEGGVVKGHVER